MKKSLFALILIWHILLNITVAQSEIIELWKGKVPNSKSAENYDLIVDTTGSWSFMRHISNPQLDVYPAKNTGNLGASVIICPGGGYYGLAFEHEGIEIAKWFNKLGITAFMLKYRLPDSEIMINKTIGPLQDAQEAVRIVRRNAEKWNIAPDKIGIMGFSAGGHLASTLSTHYNDMVYQSNDEVSARPDFSILIYPVISMDETITHRGSRNNLLGEVPDEDLIRKYSNEKQVDEKTPPAFLVHSADDGTVPVENSINYLLALQKSGVPAELHIYQNGGHGYGLGRSTNTESSWPEACIKWLNSLSLISNL